MQFRSAGGFDLATGALILGGAGLIAAAIVAAVVLISPPPQVAPAVPEPIPTAPLSGRPSAALPADRVAAALTVDVSAGAGGAARAGDHVDVLAYFSRQITGAEAVTRVVMQDVAVLNVDRSGSSVALTLALPQASALLLQEAQALGARPFVTLRPTRQSTDIPAAFSDSDLANRFAGGN